MTGTTPSDFAKRLDKTADDTEALLAKLLGDDVLSDEIAPPKRQAPAPVPRGRERSRVRRAARSGAARGRRARMHPLLLADP